ncbi:hypothetical protein D3C75_976530 [compost metagenome]
MLRQMLLQRIGKGDLKLRRHVHLAHSQPNRLLNISVWQTRRTMQHQRYADSVADLPKAGEIQLWLALVKPMCRTNRHRQ